MMKYFLESASPGFAIGSTIASILYVMEGKILLGLTSLLAAGIIFYLRSRVKALEAQLAEKTA